MKLNSRPVVFNKPTGSDGLLQFREQHMGFVMFLQLWQPKLATSDFGVFT